MTSLTIDQIKAKVVSLTEKLLTQHTTTDLTITENLVARNKTLQSLLDTRKELVNQIAPQLALVETIEKTIKSHEWDVGTYGIVNKMSVVHAAKYELNTTKLEAKLLEIGLDPNKYKITVFDLDNAHLKNFINEDVKDKVGFTQRISIK